MAGYHFLLQLNTNTVLTTNTTGAIINLPPYTSLIYRVQITAISGTHATFWASMGTPNVGGIDIGIGRTPTMYAVGTVGMVTELYASAIRINYAVAGTTPSVTITDEIEVLG